MFSWLKDSFKNKDKYKLKPLSAKEKQKIIDYALERTSKLMRETKGMSLEEVKKYKKENGYREISKKDREKYIELFNKAFQKVMKGDVKKDNNLRSLFKKAFLKSKHS